MFLFLILLSCVPSLFGMKLTAEQEVEKVLTAKLWSKFEQQQVNQKTVTVTKKGKATDFYANKRNYYRIEPYAFEEGEFPECMYVRVASTIVQNLPDSLRKDLVTRAHGWTAYIPYVSFEKTGHFFVASVASETVKNESRIIFCTLDPFLILHVLMDNIAIDDLDFAIDDDAREIFISTKKTGIIRFEPRSAFFWRKLRNNQKSIDTYFCFTEL